MSPGTLDREEDCQAPAWIKVRNQKSDDPDTEIIIRMWMVSSWFEAFQGFVTECKASHWLPMFMQRNAQTKILIDSFVRKHWITSIEWRDWMAYLEHYNIARISIRHPYTSQSPNKIFQILLESSHETSIASKVFMNTWIMEEGAWWPWACILVVSSIF